MKKEAGNRRQKSGKKRERNHEDKVNRERDAGTGTGTGIAGIASGVHSRAEQEDWRQDRASGNEASDCMCAC